MTKSAQDLKTKELVDRIVQLEALVDDHVGKILKTLSGLFDRIEALERHNVADYYNRQIDQELDAYENNPKS